MKKDVYSFRYRPGPDKDGREVFHIVLSIRRRAAAASFDKLSTLNLIYMYDVKFKYFYIKLDFLNTFSILFTDLTSHLCMKFNVQGDKWKAAQNKLL